MVYLLDSNVISELRKTRPHGAVLAWLQTIPPDDLRIPAVALTELQAGAEITRRQDPAKAAELDAWIDEIAQDWQIVPMDATIAREWAKLMERKTKALLEDALIAATARILDLVVVTRNVKDFTQFQVQMLNPFQTNPGILEVDQD